jgi:hypothetical protein
MSTLISPKGRRSAPPKLAWALHEFNFIAREKLMTRSIKALEIAGE